MLAASFLWQKGGEKLWKHLYSHGRPCNVSGVLHRDDTVPSDSSRKLRRRLLPSNHLYCCAVSPHCGYNISSASSWGDNDEKQFVRALHNRQPKAFNLYIRTSSQTKHTDGLCLTRSLIGLKQSSNVNQPIRISRYQNSLSVESHTSCRRSKVYSRFTLGFLVTAVNANNEYPPNNNSLLLLTTFVNVRIIKIQRRFWYIDIKSCAGCLKTHKYLIYQQIQA